VVKNGKIYTLNFNLLFICTGHKMGMEEVVIRVQIPEQGPRGRRYDLNHVRDWVATQVRKNAPAISSQHNLQIRIEKQGNDSFNIIYPVPDLDALTNDSFVDSLFQGAKWEYSWEIVSRPNSPIGSRNRGDQNGTEVQDLLQRYQALGTPEGIAYKVRSLEEDKKDLEGRFEASEARAADLTARLVDPNSLSVFEHSVLVVRRLLGQDYKQACDAYDAKFPGGLGRDCIAAFQLKSA